MIGARLRDSRSEQMNSRLVVRCEWKPEVGPSKCGPRRHDSFAEMLPIDKEIAQVKADLRLLEKGWDGEDAEPIDRETLLETMRFVRTYLTRLRRISFPSIGPMPNGSIDVLWKQDAGSLLVNLSNGSAATFACHYKTGERTKGTFDPSKFNPLIEACLNRTTGR
jgi:hypothetical protein